MEELYSGKVVKLYKVFLFQIQEKIFKSIHLVGD